MLPAFERDGNLTVRGTACGTDSSITVKKYIITITKHIIIIIYYQRTKYNFVTILARISIFQFFPSDSVFNSDSRVRT